MRILIAILVFTILAINDDLTVAGQSETNFNTIDESGGYRFGYHDGRVARQEEGSPDGVVRGAYSYVDADGQVQVITYTADKHNGFLVSGTNLPRVGRIPEIGEVGEVIEETPAAVEHDSEEIASERADHAESFQKAVLEETYSVPVMMDELPMPVAYTPEVAAARAEHLAAYRKELLRIGGMMRTQFHPDYVPYGGL